MTPFKDPIEAKEYHRKYYETHKEQRGKYRESHREQLREYQKKLYKIHRKEICERQKKYRREHPEVEKAHGLAKYYCPLGSRCLCCNSTDCLQRAHIDYSRPLEVLTLCRKCHRLIDKYYRGFD